MYICLISIPPRNKILLPLFSEAGSYTSLIGIYAYAFRAENSENLAATRLGGRILHEGRDPWTHNAWYAYALRIN